MFAELKHFMDEYGRLKSWPVKRKLKLIAIEYLATKFRVGVEYTEKEINSILIDFHLFSDHALLRRELFELGYLDRTADGRTYWKAIQN